MPLRLLPAVAVLLVLLTVNAHATAVIATLQLDAAYGPGVPFKQQREDRNLHLTPFFPRDRRPAQRVGLVDQFGSAVSGGMAGRSELPGILATVVSHGNPIGIPEVLESIRLFQTAYIPYFTRIEAPILRSDPDAPVPVPLPLPASGLLLSSAILFGMLLRTKHFRVQRRLRQPLRYCSA